jgi:HEAT repeat protein
MKVRYACLGGLVWCCWLGQAHGATVEQALREARAVLPRVGPPAGRDNDRLIALALEVGGGCPATVATEREKAARDQRQQTIDALVAAVVESDSRRGLIKLLRLASCGVESTAWNRERLLEHAMAHMMGAVPCLPPLSIDVASERANLVDFPVLRLRHGGLHADLPTQAELEDLAYFMVAVANAGEEIGARDEGASWARKVPGNPKRAELFRQLGEAKSGGNVVEIERLARAYLETLGFPDAIAGGEEEVFFWHAPRYDGVMQDLAASWEALGRFHDAAGLWRRSSRVGGPCGTGASYAWQKQVEAVIRDEEIDGRCDVAVAERLLDAGSDLYGPRRLVDASFDVPRLLRGALLTLNRDAGEAVVGKAIAALPMTSRVFTELRLRNQGVEDWERRVQAARGLADVTQAAAMPLLLATAEQSLPPGRQRALSAIGDLAERPPFDPCRGRVGWGHGSSDLEPPRPAKRTAKRGEVDSRSEAGEGLPVYSVKAPDLLPAAVLSGARPVRSLGRACDTTLAGAARDQLARQLFGYARDANPRTRQAVAVALGKIAAPAARPVLRRLLRDSETQGTVCQTPARTTAETCKPYRPVREAARQALTHIAEVERDWHGTQ